MIPESRRRLSARLMALGTDAMNGASAKGPLTGATVLQLAPLREEPSGRAAMDVSATLLQLGARVIVAGEGGPLADDLRGRGGEWLPMAVSRFNPLRLHHNAWKLANFVSSERIDVVHAYSAAAAWSAIRAKERLPVFTVMSFADRLSADTTLATWVDGALARGDRMIAPSSYVSRAMIERHQIAPERVTVIPRPVDTAMFNPAKIGADRIAALRKAWSVPPDTRVVLVPGPITPENGQLRVLACVQLLCDKRRIVFVFTDEAGGDQRHLRELRQQAQADGTDAACRWAGVCADMPAAFAFADVVVVAADQPVSGRAAAEAQAMGRPVVTTTAGMLPEQVLCPPRMTEELRTGWLVPPGDTGELTLAIDQALALSINAYAALGARARQFAEFAFSPRSVAEAIRGVYTSLLARDN